MSKAVEKKEFINGIDILEHEQLQSDIFHFSTFKSVVLVLCGDIW